MLSDKKKISLKKEEKKLGKPSKSRQRFQTRNPLNSRPETNKKT
jgi:hypothetical protein